MAPQMALELVPETVPELVCGWVGVFEWVLRLGAEWASEWGHQSVAELDLELVPS